MKNYFIRFIAVALCLLMMCASVACNSSIVTETTSDNGQGVEKTETSLPDASDTEGSESKTVAPETESETVSDQVQDEEKTESSAPVATDTEDSVSETVTTETEYVTTSDNQQEGDKTETTAPETTDTEGETEAVPEAGIVESDGVATVTTENGLVFKATGYTRINGGSFVFTSGLEFSFSPDTFADEFNRLTLNYKSTVPTHIYVTYKAHNGNDTVADFFLEKGEGDFSGLILDYLDKKTASEITRIVVDTCDGKNGRFELRNLSVEQIDCYIIRYGYTQYYIENERFELGVDLAYGGAICSLRDKTCNIPGLTNLVNKADAGRLIQQSYYGTGAIPGVYEPGVFNNSKWSYNPVQGGDQYGNHSRIIDVVVTENSMHVKAQPQDWSLNGAITPSYMENTFILHEDYIEIKNRFVDFSGWTHPYSTQEIPAFYTVSYLDSFAWYDGSEPWTGDELSYRDDLNFWGDPNFHGDCTFTMKRSNTETWCAWFNSENDFGLGVFVPNADVFLAGRASFNGSKDPDAGPCGYVAPLKRLKLVSYEALEYSYLLTTGSVEDIRATFTEHKDFSANEGLDKNSIPMRQPEGEIDHVNLDFTNEDYAYMFVNHNSVTTAYDSTEMALKVTVIGEDPYAALSFTDLNPGYDAINYKTLEIVYMVPTTNALEGYSIEIFLSTGDVLTAVGGKSVVETLICDGEYHTLSIDLSNVSFWYGKINEIRIDFFTGAQVDDVIYLKSFALK